METKSGSLSQFKFTLDVYVELQWEENKESGNFVQKDYLWKIST